MNLVTTLSVERVSIEHDQFWPPDTRKLVVIVWQLDPHSDRLVAYGIDPGPARGHGRVVVEAEFRLAKLSAFIKTVIDNVERDVRPHCDKFTIIAGHHHQDDATSDAKYLVREASVALAASIRAEERLAEAVVNPSPPRRSPPREQSKVVQR